MRTFFCLLLSVTLSVSLYAQQKEQAGRYQIFKVASMTNNEVKSDPMLFAGGSGGKEDVIMVDTQTGRTWILNYSIESGGEGSSPSAKVLRFQWEEMCYSYQVGKYWQKTILPPPEEKKSYITMRR